VAVLKELGNSNFMYNIQKSIGWASWPHRCSVFQWSSRWFQTIGSSDYDSSNASSYYRAICHTNTTTV